MKQRTKKRCLLCGDVLRSTSVATLWLHDPSEKCKVRVADENGISADDRYFIDEEGNLFEYEVPMDAPTELELQLQGATDIVSIKSAFVTADKVLEVIFDNAGVPRLGGASGDRGWSSLSTYQRCPYLWKRRYLGVKVIGDDQPGPASREVGSLIHTFLAIYYQRFIEPEYPLTPEQCRQFLLDGFVTPDHVNEAWRLFEAYRIYYMHDAFVPLAAEYHLVDPRTGRSCRYDLIARLDKPMAGLLPGTYIMDHKSTSRFDQATLTQWRNDGELIGQWELYELLHLEKRFGPLQGLCANLIGKQKDPKFERAWIRPSDALLRDHKKSTAIWSARLTLAKATSDFPRARANCVTRFGLCDQFDHCAQEAEA